MCFVNILCNNFFRNLHSKINNLKAFQILNIEPSSLMAVSNLKQTNRKIYVYNNCNIPYNTVSPDRTRALDDVQFDCDRPVLLLCTYSLYVKFHQQYVLQI